MTLNEHRVARLRDGAAVANVFGVSNLGRLLDTCAANLPALPDAVAREAVAVAAMLADGNKIMREVAP